MLIITGDEALRTRQDSQFLPKFSKQYASGMTAVTYYRIMYSERTRKNAVLVGADWGHKADFKKIALGKDFIKSNAVIKENKPTTVDALLRFSRLAPAYLDGEFAYKKQVVLTSGQPEPIIKQNLATIDEEYKLANPAIGPLTYVIFTECIFVPLDDSGRPKIADIRLVTQELSNKKLQEISKAINDGRMVVHPDRGYAELQYVFGNTKNKNEDGKVAPTGTPKDYELETLYPEDFKIIQEWIGKLPVDSEQIMNRNRAFDTVPEEEIVSAISAYATGANMYLTMIDKTDSKNVGRMKSNAALLKELGADIKIQEVKDAMDAVGKEAVEEAESRTKKLLEQEVTEAIKNNDEDRDDVLAGDDVPPVTEEKKEESEAGSPVDATMGF